MAQLLQTIEVPAMNKFGLEYFECRFGYRIVVGTAFHAEGPCNAKCFYDLVNDFVFKLTASIRVKHLDVAQISLHHGKCVIDQLRVFVDTGAVTNNFPIE